MLVTYNQAEWHSAKFEVDATTAFSTLDTNMKGSLLASAIKTTM
jgi:hypothetical protein